jgi:hypothetical protein
VKEKVHFFHKKKYSLYSKGYKYIQRLSPQKEPHGEHSWWIDIESTKQAKPKPQIHLGISYLVKR